MLLDTLELRVHAKLTLTYNINKIKVSLNKNPKHLKLIIDFYVTPSKTLSNKDTWVCDAHDVDLTHINIVFT